MSSYVDEVVSIHLALANWTASANRNGEYLLDEIIAAAFGFSRNDSESLRIAPHAGHLLPELGMENQRKRGHRGNRHYWVFA